MTPLRLALAAAALSISAAQASAATVGGYTFFGAFGDSLTDPGNLYFQTGDTFPPDPPYFDGRFSNGPVWAEYVADRFTAAGRNSANFAFGLANAVPDGIDPVPDLPQQVAGFNFVATPGLLGTRPLLSFWFGSNDIFTNLDQPAPTLAGVVAVAEAAANAIGTAVFNLAAGGFNDFVLFNLPDLGQIPRFALFDPADAPLATAAAAAFNMQLSVLIAELRFIGVNVIEIDIESLFESLIADPGQFGLTNATTPCLVFDPPSQCTLAESLDWAFFDQSHPNLVVHGIIGDRVIAAIVPLPASVLMLGAGLAGLGLLRRRRAA